MASNRGYVNIQNTLLQVYRFIIFTLIKSTYAMVGIEVYTKLNIFFTRLSQILPENGKSKHINTQRKMVCWFIFKLRYMDTNNKNV
jgi:hypothetical protein